MYCVHEIRMDRARMLPVFAYVVYMRPSLRQGLRAHFTRSAHAENVNRDLPESMHIYVKQNVCAFGKD